MALVWRDSIADSAAFSNSFNLHIPSFPREIMSDSTPTTDMIFQWALRQRCMPWPCHFTSWTTSSVWTKGTWSSRQRTDCGELPKEVCNAISKSRTSGWSNFACYCCRGPPQTLLSGIYQGYGPCPARPSQLPSHWGCIWTHRNGACRGGKFACGRDCGGWYTLIIHGVRWSPGALPI
jgi:hypothetical protein